MTKCPAHLRIISHLVCQNAKDYFLHNRTVVLHKSPLFEGDYFDRLSNIGLVDPNWRFSPDPLFNSLWSNYRNRWRLIVGLAPLPYHTDWLSAGTPVCRFAMVQFETEDDWGHFIMKFTGQRLVDPCIRRPTRIPRPPLHPDRLRRCPPKSRLISAVLDEQSFTASPNSIVIYGWDKRGKGLVEADRQTRKELLLHSRGLGRARPDELFNFLHTKFRGKWQLTLLRWPDGRARQLGFL